MLGVHAATGPQIEYCRQNCLNQKNEFQVPQFSCEEFAVPHHKYVVLIPVLNEGERIRNQLDRMKPLVDLVDICVVDGGSVDNALSKDFLVDHGVVAFLIKLDPGGLSSQLRIGLWWALQKEYQGIVLIDGNNKDNPEQIPDFLKALDEGYDHVQGSRFIPGGVHENTPWIRLLALRCLHAPLIRWASGFPYTDTTNGFRAYSRKFLMDPGVLPFRDEFKFYELHYYLSIRAPRLNFRVREIPVERRYPRSEKTPTKIAGIRAYWRVLTTLIGACAGQYNPRTN